MGILKDSMNGNSPDPGSDPRYREEEYEKLYMKIARDFVHKDDLASILNTLIATLSEASLRMDAILSDANIPVRESSAAIQKAMLYQWAMDNNEDIVKRFASSDVIRTDED